MLSISLDKVTINLVKYRIMCLKSIGLALGLYQAFIRPYIYVNICDACFHALNNKLVILKFGNNVALKKLKHINIYQIDCIISSML